MSQFDIKWLNHRFMYLCKIMIHVLYISDPRMLKRAWRMKNKQTMTGPQRVKMKGPFPEFFILHPQAKPPIFWASGQEPWVIHCIRSLSAT